ncbi:MAG: hypothetical protein EA399_14825 [Desulfovibrionales bacterium]|nr:MAG: hypothetical protein EA399_14825 [Desulfovibrionales bacterium]
MIHIIGCTARCQPFMQQKETASFWKILWQFLWQCLWQASAQKYPDSVDHAPSTFVFRNLGLG